MSYDGFQSSASFYAEEDSEIKKKFQQKNLFWEHMPGDGSCFFHAVKHAIKPHFYYGGTDCELWEDMNEEYPRELRELIVNRIHEEFEQYSDHIKSGYIDEKRLRVTVENVSDQEAYTYLETLKNPATYIVGFVISAFAKLVRREVIILNNNAEIIIKYEPSESYQREPILVHYNGHNHYNKVEVKRGISIYTVIDNLPRATRELERSMRSVSPVNNSALTQRFFLSLNLNWSDCPKKDSFYHAVRYGIPQVSIGAQLIDFSKDTEYPKLFKEHFVRYRQIKLDAGQIKVLPTSTLNEIRVKAFTLYFRIYDKYVIVLNNEGKIICNSFCFDIFKKPENQLQPIFLHYDGTDYHELKPVPGCDARAIVEKLQKVPDPDSAFISSSSLSPVESMHLPLVADLARGTGLDSLSPKARLLRKMTDIELYKHQNSYEILIEHLDDIPVPNLLFGVRNHIYHLLLNQGNAGKVQYRPYQCKRFVEFINGLNAGVQLATLVLPTGTGKTKVMVKLMSLYREVFGGTVLFVSSRTLINEQLKADIQLIEPNANIVISVESKPNSSANYIIATYANLNRQSTQVYSDIENAGLNICAIVLDEAHQCAPATYTQLKEKFDVPVLACSATLDHPIGAKRRSARYDVFNQLSPDDGVLSPFSLIDAITLKCLKPIKVFDIKITDKINIENGLTLSHAEDDYDDKKLGNFLNKPAFSNTLIKALLNPHISQWIAGKQGIIHSCNIAHAEAIAKAFNENKTFFFERFKINPVRRLNMTIAVAVHSKMTSVEKNKIFSDYRIGNILYLVGADMLIEGFDQPKTSVIVLNKPTKSRGRMIQMVGRGLRLITDSPNTNCIVLHFDWGLEGVAHIATEIKSMEIGGVQLPAPVLVVPSTTELPLMEVCQYEINEKYNAVLVDGDSKRKSQFALNSASQEVNKKPVSPDDLRGKLKALMETLQKKLQEIRVGLSSSQSEVHIKKIEGNNSTKMSPPKGLTPFVSSSGPISPPHILEKRMMPPSPAASAFMPKSLLNEIEKTLGDLKSLFQQPKPEDFDGEAEVESDDVQPKRARAHGMNGATRTKKKVETESVLLNTLVYSVHKLCGVNMGHSSTDSLSSTGAPSLSFDVTQLASIIDQLESRLTDLNNKPIVEIVRNVTLADENRRLQEIKKQQQEEAQAQVLMMQQKEAQEEAQAQALMMQQKKAQEEAQAQVLMMQQKEAQAALEFMVKQREVLNKQYEEEQKALRAQHLAQAQAQALMMQQEAFGFQPLGRVQTQSGDITRYLNNTQHQLEQRFRQHAHSGATVDRFDVGYSLGSIYLAIQMNTFAIIITPLCSGYYGSIQMEKRIEMAKILVDKVHGVLLNLSPSLIRTKTSLIRGGAIVAQNGEGGTRITVYQKYLSGHKNHECDECKVEDSFQDLIEIHKHQDNDYYVVCKFPCSHVTASDKTDKRDAKTILISEACAISTAKNPFQRSEQQALQPVQAAISVAACFICNDSKITVDPTAGEAPCWLCSSLV